MSEQNETRIVALEDIKRALAELKNKEIKELVLTDFGDIRCFVDSCQREPSYTIGTLLPSVWFDVRERKRLIPVIYSACIEHRFILLDRVPARTVSVIVRDVSPQSHEIVKDMLKQALINKEEELVIYYK